MTDWWYGFLIGSLVGGGIMLVFCSACVRAVSRRADGWELAAGVLEDEVKSLDPEGWEKIERLNR